MGEFDWLHEIIQFSIVLLEVCCCGEVWVLQGLATPLGDVVCVYFYWVEPVVVYYGIVPYCT